MTTTTTTTATRYAAGELPSYAVAWHPQLTQGWAPLAEIPELQSGGAGGQSSPSPPPPPPPAAASVAEEAPEMPGRSRLRNLVGRRPHRLERLPPSMLPSVKEVLLERTEPGYMRQKETSPLRRLVRSTK